MNKMISTIFAALVLLVLFGCENKNSNQSTNCCTIQLPTTNCFKITVTSRGMVRIPYQDLAFAADISELNTSEINLYRAEKAIPILIEDGGDGKIDKGDSIIFFCGQENPRSPSDVFFLKRIKASEKPLRYTSSNALAPNPAANKEFWWTRSKTRVPLRIGPADQTLNTGFSAPEREVRQGRQLLLTERLTNNLITPFGYVSARLVLTLDRREEAVANGVEHKIEIIVNGKIISHETIKQSPTRRQIACDFRLKAFSKKGNRIYLKNITKILQKDRDAFVSATIGIEDGFLEILDSPKALNGQAVLEKTEDKADAMQVQGFSSQNIRVFAPRVGKIIENIIVKPNDSNYVLFFNPTDASVFAATQSDAFLGASVESYEIETSHEVFLRRPNLRATKNEADYLIIVPRNFMHAVKPLAELRKKQMSNGKPLKVMTLAAEDIYDQFGYGLFGPKPIRDFIAHTQKNWKRPPRYVLLAADASRDKDFANPGHTIPCSMYRSYRSGLIGTDNRYGFPDRRGAPKIAVGRLPADNSLELKTMVEKIVEYETTAQAGAWQRKMQIFAGTAGYGPQLDSLLEKMFNMIFGNLLPRRFDLEISYAGKNLDYYYPAEQFRKHIIDKINEGALYTAYIGHGAVDRLDRIRSANKVYPIFENADTKKLSSADRRTIMFLITCSSGAYDLNQNDCLAEMLVKSEGGPVAVIAGSSETHPYANGVLGIEMLPAFFGRNGKSNALSVPTRQPIGDVLLALKRESITEKSSLLGSGGGFNILRAGLDVKAEEWLGVNSNKSKRLRRDHQYLYNLVGDPAMRPAMPDNIIMTASADKARPGNTLQISGKCENIPDGKATITLECDITKSLYPKPLHQDKSTQEYIEQHRRINDKVVTTIEAIIKEGKFTIDLKIPESVTKTNTALAPGSYFIKVLAQSKTECAIGAIGVEIEAPKSESE